MIHFYKYQGTGNDFILIDNRSLNFNKQDTKLISRLCERKFGIGSDGLMLLERHPDSDFRLHFFNPDGSQSFCGNGTRCAVALAVKLGIAPEKGQVLATDGVHAYQYTPEQVSISVHDVSSIQTIGKDYWLNTGSPHYIVFTDDVSKIDVVQEGRNVRYSEAWRANGTNVNFVQQTTEGIRIRTYERGVENETLSCGTGVTAAALASAAHFRWDKQLIEVQTEGGVLYVKFERKSEAFKHIWLCGPATPVFEGDAFI